jgi:hypothetical protein
MKIVRFAVVAASVTLALVRGSVTFAQSNLPPVAVATVGNAAIFPPILGDYPGVFWVISPDGVDALVEFDGSASFDPEGAVLSYEWWADGTFAFTAVATDRVQVGGERVRLTVGDGAAASTVVFDLIVVSPSTVASILRDVLDDAALPGRARNALTLPLHRAEASFDSGDLAEGVRQVEIFRKRVLVQPTGTDAATTAALAALAQELIDTVQQ